MQGPLYLTAQWLPAGLSMVSPEYSPFPDKILESVWRSPAFRSCVTSRVNDGITKSSRKLPAKGRTAEEMEEYIFLKAKTKEEYLENAARIIIFLRNDGPPPDSDGSSSREQTLFEGGSSGFHGDVSESSSGSFSDESESGSDSIQNEEEDDCDTDKTTALLGPSVTAQGDPTPGGPPPQTESRNEETNDQNLTRKATRYLV